MGIGLHILGQGQRAMGANLTLHFLTKFLLKIRGYNTSLKSPSMTF